MSLVSNWKKDQNNEYEGEVHRYLASENILKGQPVCWHLNGNGDMTASLIHNGKTDQHYIGIALNDASLNNYVDVLKRGDVYCKRISTYPSPTPTLINLNNLTHHTTTTEKYITFRDDGNTGNYSATQQRQIYMNAGVGNTWTITLNSAGFEHTLYSLYDRLLLWVATDQFGEVWQKADITGWESCTSTSEYGGSGKGGSSTPKNVVPNHSGSSITYNIPNQWIRWNFYSDTSSVYSGWDMTITASDYSPSNNAVDVPVNTPLYVDESDNNCTETPNTSWSLTKILGNVILPTASNDKVKIRINN
jgi:hypothetical protein